jgi:hypothetical protein
MTSASINNGQRKQLSTQLDRLDSILDGLSEALTESVADAVKEVIGQVVSEAVALAVKEVLSSPDLLKAALSKHEHAMPTVKRKTLKELLKTAGSRTVEKVKQVSGQLTQKLGQGISWCWRKLKQGLQRGKEIAVGSVRACNGVAVIGGQLWRFRKTCSIALAVGILSGVSTYFAGPVLASIASDVTRRAFANLWKVQVRDGSEKGSWDWLDFQLEPWESRKARYFGAALAAVAVGTSPGYFTTGDRHAVRSARPGGTGSG